jgi:hypothetical protein
MGKDHEGHERTGPNEHRKFDLGGAGAIACADGRMV